jgi:hypothetical protein
MLGVRVLIPGPITTVLRKKKNGVKNAALRWPPI